MELLLKKYVDDQNKYKENKTKPKSMKNKTLNMSHSKSVGLLIWFIYWGL